MTEPAVSNAIYDAGVVVMLVLPILVMLVWGAVESYIAQRKEKQHQDPPAKIRRTAKRDALPANYRDRLARFGEDCW